MKERGVLARSAKSVFFQDENDIDIYIEDTAYGYEKLFAIIFERILVGKYKVSRVYPLGGRESVIEEHQDHSSDRPSIYIIDGDLNLLKGDSIESKSGLYVFPVYCVENILCDSNAIVSILDEEEVVRNINDIKCEFDYSSWLERNESKLFDIFVEYAVSNALNPTKKTVSYKVSNLVSSGDGELDSTKVNARIDEIRQAVIAEVSVEEYMRKKTEILEVFSRSGLKKIDVVSGKDYIFPLLKIRAKNIVKTKISDINFKLRVARICDTERLDGVLDCILHE